MTDAEGPLPAVMAVTVMLETETGRISVQWPPQLSAEGAAQALVAAVQALAQISKPTPQIELPNAATVKALTR